MNTTILITFFLYTVFVVVFTYLKLKKTNRTTNDAYFLGGRSLTGKYITGTLILTNLSAISFVGMSAQAYSGNISVMGWEVLASTTLIIVALFLLPRYLKQGITTIPDFLENRYSKNVRLLVTILFLFQYVVNVLPVTLYAGARILLEIVDVQGYFGVTEFAAIGIIVGVIASLGMFYAVFGGLKAVATANSLNSVGLLVGGLAILIFGLLYLGGGHFNEGILMLFESSPEKFQSIGGAKDPLPFGTVFTGLILVNLYYWGTDQAIIQSSLGAKNLKEAQKGVLWMGALKVFTPLIVIVPGIIAFNVFGADAGNPDAMYSRLVNEVLPRPLVGLFVAVMFGAILGTFSSVLNGAATLFTLNVYKPLIKQKGEENSFVREGRTAVVVIALLSAIIAPFIMYAPAGLFDFLQRVSGFFSVPVFTIVLVGYISNRAPSVAAMIAMIVFVSSYAMMQVVFQTDLHFLHQLAILFVICTLLMFLIGIINPRKTPYVIPGDNNINLTPWKYRKEVAMTIMYFVIGAYLLFSDLGLLAENRIVLKIYSLLSLPIFVLFVRKLGRK